MSTVSPFTKADRDDGKAWPLDELKTAYDRRWAGWTWVEIARAAGTRSGVVRKVLRHNLTPEAWAELVLRFAATVVEARRRRRKRLATLARRSGPMTLEAAASLLRCSTATVQDDLDALGLREQFRQRQRAAARENGRRVGMGQPRWHREAIASVRLGWPPVPSGQRRWLVALEEAGGLTLREWIGAVGLTVDPNRSPRLYSTTGGALARAGHVVKGPRRRNRSNVWLLSPTVAERRLTARRLRGGAA